MQYEIADQVKNNILAFLQRVDLKGAEVPAYIEAVQAFSAPIKVEQPASDEQK